MASRRCSNGPGTSVTREFYINDAGVQIDKLVQSLVGAGAAGGWAGRPRFPRAATTASIWSRLAEQILAA